jgi:hypothetical protein
MTGQFFISPGRNNSRRREFVAGLVLLLGVGLLAPQSRADDSVPAVVDSERNGILRDVVDCRYLTTEAPGIAFDRRHLGSGWFPGGERFRPLVADMRQPRFFLSPRRVLFDGDALPAGGTDNRINAGLVGMGTEFGIWSRSRKRRCDGIQVSLLGAINSQFNLDAESDALLNTDFIIGPSVTLRRGNISYRIRLYHQSSHLGDEFILQNPDIERVNLSIEVLDFLVSREWRKWRVYGGFGYLAGAEPRLDPIILTVGSEFRLPVRRYAVGLTPVVGLHITSLEAREWDLTTNLVAGVEMSNTDGTRRYRVLFAYLRGFIPFGQFFDTARLESYGLTLQFDF